MTIIKRELFKKKIFVKHKGTSISRGIYELEGENPTDHKYWVLKDNPIDWTVIEYISYKLYRKILGDEFVADSVLVIERDTLSLAVSQFSEFTDLGKDEHGYSDDVIFSNDNYVKSVLASMLFWEGDSHMQSFSQKKHLNYAMISVKGKEYVTRFDFDDSLKFLFFNKFLQPLNGIGHYENYFHRVSYNPMEYKYVHFGINYDNIRSKSLQEIEPVRLLKAMKEITAIDVQEINMILKQTIYELQFAIGEEKFSKIFNLNTMQLAIDNYSTLNTLGFMNIVGFVRDFSKFLGLYSSSDPAEIVYNGFKALMTEVFSRFLRLEQCLSLEVEMKDNNVQLDVNKELASHGCVPYQNEATEIVGQEGSFDNMRHEL